VPRDNGPITGQEPTVTRSDWPPGSRHRYVGIPVEAAERTDRADALNKLETKPYFLQSAMIWCRIGTNTVGSTVG
jgi:hypothetical protein